MSPSDCATTPGATFSWPITLNLYDTTTTTTTGTSPVFAGELIASVTKKFKIPYRPSANPAKWPSNPGQWFKNGQCYNGKAANITFGLGSLHLRLPNHIVWGIAFNTSNYGPHPVGPAACDSTPEGCPYDSLNLALSPRLAVGSKPFPLTAFQNTATTGNLCDGAAVAELNVFNLDSPDNACWFDSTTNKPFIPAAKFVADS